MSHGHASQEGEHASHLAHDPFDRRVAMSMVVIAAVLAAVKVIGHRTHNDTLAYQIEANVAHTQASNTFGFFQAKRQRMELAQLQSAQLALLVPLSPEARSVVGSANDVLPDRTKRLEELKKDLDSEQVEDAAGKAEAILTSGEERYQALRKKGFPSKEAAQVAGLEMNVRRYRLEADAIVARARSELEKAQSYQEKSARSHHKADYFDLGELGVELALVLSSVAILTKRGGYWYWGIMIGLAGVIAVLLGFLAH